MLLWVVWCGCNSVMVLSLRVVLLVLLALWCCVCGMLLVVWFVVVCWCVVYVVVVGYKV